MQKENLELERKRLEIEKQRLEQDKLLRSQVLDFMPIFTQFVQSVMPKNETEETASKKRKLKVVDESFLKGSKILRATLENGKNYSTEEDSDGKESSNEGDSGIHNDENSVSSDK